MPKRRQRQRQRHRQRRAPKKRPLAEIVDDIEGIIYENMAEERMNRAIDYIETIVEKRPETLLELEYLLKLSQDHHERDNILASEQLRNWASCPTPVPIPSPIPRPQELPPPPYVEPAVPITLAPAPVPIFVSKPSPEFQRGSWQQIGSMNFATSTTLATSCTGLITATPNILHW